MIRKLAFVTAAAVLGAALVSASAADVTFVLKNGDRVSGTLVYRHTTDFSIVRSGREQTYPSDDIALIQFTGGDPSRDELAQLPNVDNNPNELERHVFVFRNGNIMRGKLHDIVDDWFDFDAQQGGRRKHGLSELARLYFNPASARRVYNFDAQPVTQPGAGGGEIRVEANRRFTSAGINVSRGERIRFEVNGDIRIGPNVGAGPDGNPGLEKRLSYPVRTAAAGALIGRVGNSAPFAIGSRGEVVMPADGPLSLGINDDRFEDNSGWFTVRVIRSTAAPNRR